VLEKFVSPRPWVATSNRPPCVCSLMGPRA
jgi:hypothetical protein